MKKFIVKPSVDLYPGVKVYKDTVLQFKGENVEQRVENLVLYSKAKAVGENYESEYNTKVYLEEGDILIFEEDGRGYIKPVESFVTIEEAINDLESIKDLG